MERLPRSGISYNLDLDYALAAQWWGHQEMSTFQELPEAMQAYLVAVFRAQSMIDSVVSHQQAKDLKAEAERNNRR